MRSITEPENIEACFHNYLERNDVRSCFPDADVVIIPDSIDFNNYLGNELNYVQVSKVISFIENQTIDEDGLHSETDKGTSNLKDWNFQFRGFDNRGGGLLSGFIGGSN